MPLDDGRPRTAALYARSATRSWPSSAAATRADLAEATELLDRLVLGDDFPDFLTLEAYARLD